MPMTDVDVGRDGYKNGKGRGAYAEDSGRRREKEATNQMERMRTATKC